VLSCRSVSKNFGGNQALRSVDLTVRKNEISGLVGPNGSGKSTLLNIISGIHRPDFGKITFLDEDITMLPPFKICAKGITKTSQIVQSFPDMTTIENVLVAVLFAVNHGVKDREDAVYKSKDILKFVGLEENKFNVPVKNLNLVEHRRVQLAKALATNPKLLLLDELLTGLNPKETEKAIELIKCISGQGITILIVEHVMRIIMSLCDRLTVLHHGEKISEGKPQDVINDKAVVKIYLGKKYAYYGD
jgi:branched-chain amino acid transport system ATP-binding protein